MRLLLSEEVSAPLAFPSDWVGTRRIERALLWTPDADNQGGPFGDAKDRVDTARGFREGASLKGVEWDTRWSCLDITASSPCPA